MGRYGYDNAITNLTGHTKTMRLCTVAGACALCWP